MTFKAHQCLALNTGNGLQTLTAVLAANLSYRCSQMWSH